MRISGINMFNNYQTKSVSMKGLMKDEDAIRQLDKFMSENDLVLNTVFQPKPDLYNNRFFATLSKYQRKNGVKEKLVPLVSINNYNRAGYNEIKINDEITGAGRTLKEAKLDIIKNYKGSQLYIDGKYYTKMPEFKN